jgi:hypothetical protein
MVYSVSKQADTEQALSGSSPGRENMSDYLFATPSFLSGAARALDLGGVFDGYNISPSPEVANARGLVADWLAVAGHLCGALKEFKADLGPQEVA